MFLNHSADVSHRVGVWLRQIDMFPLARLYLEPRVIKVYPDLVSRDDLLKKYITLFFSMTAEIAGTPKLVLPFPYPVTAIYHGC